MRTIVFLLAALVSSCAVAPQSRPEPPVADVNFATACQDLGAHATVTSATRWSRTAAEHQALYLQVFAMAEDRLATVAKPAQPWAIVTDADETIIDNTPYQCAFELAGSGQFNRELWKHSPTRANFSALGMAVDAVLFSLGPDDRDKNRRFQAIERNGIAAENLPPLAVLMYLGDNIADFPDLSQANIGDRRRFGSSYFVFPNAMYGSFSGNTLR